MKLTYSTDNQPSSIVTTRNILPPLQRKATQTAQVQSLGIKDASKAAAPASVSAATDCEREARKD
eukprot:6187857-Pleurochrysis_carterae.AAC.1